MKILGPRILVSKIEEEKKDGFQTVDVQDSFVYKGKVEQIGGIGRIEGTQTFTTGVAVGPTITVGDTVVFAKYSPDTQELDHEGAKYKVVKIEDVIAIL